MRRRDFIAGLGGAGAWPLAGRAQQARIPVIGFLAVGPNDAKRWGPSFPQGLTEAGYVEGQNLAIDYRGGPPSIDRLRELATELVRRQGGGDPHSQRRAGDGGKACNVHHSNRFLRHRF